MSHKHIDPDLFERLLSGEISSDEACELLWHLIESCPECDRVGAIDRQVDRPTAIELPRLKRIRGPVEEAEVGDRKDRISFDRVRERLAGPVGELFRQKDEAPALLEELVEHPIERQELLIRNNRRFQTVPLAELWLERAWEVGLEDPAAAETMAELVLEMVDQIDSGPTCSEIRNDVRARAWSFRGNFRRILTDFRGAEEAFSKAEDHLRRGTGDLLEAARFYGLKATLRRNQRCLDEARDLLQKAVGIYLSTEEHHLAGRAMISQALLLNEDCRPDEAIRVLHEALEMIDPEREPHLVLVAQQNLVQYLNALGRNEEALALLPKVRRQTVAVGSRFELLRLRWLEGQILLGLGRDLRAEAAFLEVRKGFTELGVGYDMALVSLELAALYLRQGRTAEIKRLAAQMVPIFESRDVHQDAIAAVMLFKQAVEMETLTARMVEEVSEVLQRSKARPRPWDDRPS